MVVARIFWSWSQGNAGKYSAAACGKPSGEGGERGNRTVRDRCQPRQSSVPPLGPCTPGKESITMCLLFFSAAHRQDPNTGILINTFTNRINNTKKYGVASTFRGRQSY